MVEGLLLDDGVAVGQELEVAVVVATLGWMDYAIDGHQVFRIDSDGVVLVGDDACRTDIHGHCERSEGVGAGNSHVVDHADHGITHYLIRSGPEPAVPCMVVQDESYLKSHQDIA